VRLKVDVIVTAGTPATRAAMQAAGTIPIVMAAVADPVAPDWSRASAAQAVTSLE
jgi:ABC-type uncharacterized transport system substrate-binding protein